jgi:hypothetical protein
MNSSLRRLGCFLLVATSGVAGAAVSHAQLPPPAYPPQAPPPAPAEPPLTTGGLTPPPTTEVRSGETETLYTLERAEREDSGRGLEFVWLQAEAGYEYLALQSFQANSLVDAGVVADNGSAFAFGAAAGVRLVFITLGARFRLAQFSDWDLWTLNGEIGLHVPLGVIEPSFSFGAGYASLGAFDLSNAAGLSGDGVDISGFDARVGAALDWYVNPLLSLGAHSSFDLLVLYRDATPSSDLSEATPELREIYARDGDGIGIGVTVTGVVGLHF